MEPKNTLHKKIGIFLSLAVVFVVGLVTLVSERKTPVAPVTTTTSKSSSKNSPANTNTTVRASNSEDDNESFSDDSSGSATPAAPAKTPVASTAVTPADTRKQAYKNGSYTATGSYMSPGGQEQITVSLTLAKDIITDVSVTPGAYDHTSARYQDKFISGYKQYVVGKNIADVSLTIVSGASLTPEGFNDALNQIKAQAQA